MTGQAILLLSDHATYMTGGEYFVDGCVSCNGIGCTVLHNIRTVGNSFGKGLPPKLRNPSLCNCNVQTNKVCAVRVTNNIISVTRQRVNTSTLTQVKGIPHSIMYNFSQTPLSDLHLPWYSLVFVSADASRSLLFCCGASTFRTPSASCVTISDLSLFHFW